MAHKIARLLLEHADTFLERSDAVETALSLGMPLQEIEEYLDWLETVGGPGKRGASQADSSADQRHPKAG